MPDLAAFISPSQWLALEWLSHLALEKKNLFPPSHPLSQAHRLFYLHYPVASSLHVSCSSAGLRMSPVACKRATEPVAPGFMSRGPLSQLRKLTEMAKMLAKQKFYDFLRVRIGHLLLEY